MGKPTEDKDDARGERDEALREQCKELSESGEENSDVEEEPRRRSKRIEKKEGTPSYRDVCFCEYCHENFKSEDALLKHEQQNHVEMLAEEEQRDLTKQVDKYSGLKKRLHHCRYCYWSFSSSEVLSKHHLQSHNGNESLKCPHCPIVLFDKYDRECHGFDHVQEDGSLTFDCGECKAVFKDPEQFAAHFKQHYESRQFVCHICSDRFKTAFMCSQHTKEWHPVDKKPDAADSNKDCDELAKEESRDQVEQAKTFNKKNHRSFNCSICPCAFSSKNVLLYHIKTWHKTVKSVVRRPNRPGTFPSNVEMRIHNHEDRANMEERAGKRQKVDEEPSQGTVKKVKEEAQLVAATAFDEPEPLADITQATAEDATEVDIKSESCAEIVPVLLSNQAEPFGDIFFQNEPTVKVENNGDGMVIDQESANLLQNLIGMQNTTEGSKSQNVNITAELEVKNEGDDSTPVTQPKPALAIAQADLNDSTANIAPFNELEVKFEDDDDCRIIDYIPPPTTFQNEVKVPHADNHGPENEIHKETPLAAGIYVRAAQNPNEFMIVWSESLDDDLIVAMNLNPDRAVLCVKQLDLVNLSVKQKELINKSNWFNIYMLHNNNKCVPWTVICFGGNIPVLMNGIFINFVDVEGNLIKHAEDREKSIHHVMKDSEKGLFPILSQQLVKNITIFK